MIEVDPALKEANIDVELVLGKGSENGKCIPSGQVCEREPCKLGDYDIIIKWPRGESVYLEDSSKKSPKTKQLTNEPVGEEKAKTTVSRKPKDGTIIKLVCGTLRNPDSKKVPAEDMKDARAGYADTRLRLAPSIGKEDPKKANLTGPGTLKVISITCTPCNQDGKPMPAVH